MGKTPQPGSPLPHSSNGRPGVPRPSKSTSFQKIVPEGELIEIDESAPTAYVVHRGSVEVEMQVVTPKGVTAIKLDTIERGHCLHLSSFFGTIPEKELALRYRAKSRVVLTPLAKSLLPRRVDALLEVVDSIVSTFTLRERHLRQHAAHEHMRAEAHPSISSDLVETMHEELAEGEARITELNDQLVELQKLNASLRRALAAVQDENHALHSQRTPSAVSEPTINTGRFPSAMKLLAVQDPTAADTASESTAIANKTSSAKRTIASEPETVPEMVSSPKLALDAGFAERPPSSQVSVLDDETMDALFQEYLTESAPVSRQSSDRIFVPSPRRPDNEPDSGSFDAVEPGSNTHPTRPYKPASNEYPAAADVDIPPPPASLSPSVHRSFGELHDMTADDDLAEAMTFATSEPAPALDDMDELEVIGPVDPSEHIPRIDAVYDDAPDIEIQTPDADPFPNPVPDTYTREIIEDFQSNPMPSLNGPPIPGPPPSAIRSQPKLPRISVSAEASPPLRPVIPPSKRIVVPTPGIPAQDPDDMSWIDEPEFSTTQTYQSPIHPPKPKK